MVLPQISKPLNKVACNKKQKKLSELDHFKARMNMPIGSSSFGIPITDDVRKEIERVAREYHL